jgi:hypothetical protein
LAAKKKEKRSLQAPRHRWHDKNKMVLKEKYQKMNLI